MPFVSGWFLYDMNFFMGAMLLSLWPIIQEEMAKRTVHVTRRERFSAAHKLWNPAWDEAANLSTFGKCANPNWHGHNYELFVTVKGEPNADTGFCIDLKYLSTLIQVKVTSKLDHKNINLDVDFMTGIMPSTENLAIHIWEQLSEEIGKKGCSLHSVRLHETENNMVEYFGG
jgi:6-pyruvoyltetrahydropterin/6-carboxytetrahydropterin synthase